MHQIFSLPDPQAGPDARPSRALVRRATRSADRRRSGYTMTEALIVISISAVLTMLMLPRIEETRARSSLRAARLELSAAFSAARSAAMQKGKNATLTVTSGAATVSVLSGLNGNPVTVYGPVHFDKDLRSTLTPLDGSATTISFDARGLVNPVPDGVAKYRLSSGSYSDTLCVSAAGIILPRGCQL